MDFFTRLDETLVVDVDKGHWLAAGEVDGRNATEELVARGDSGRTVLLSRPAGYGLAPGMRSLGPSWPGDFSCPPG